MPYSSSEIANLISEKAVAANHIVQSGEVIFNEMYANILALAEVFINVVKEIGAVKFASFKPEADGSITIIYDGLPRFSLYVLIILDPTDEKKLEPPSYCVRFGVPDSGTNVDIRHKKPSLFSFPSIKDLVTVLLWRTHLIKHHQKVIDYFRKALSNGEYHPETSLPKPETVGCTSAEAPTPGSVPTEQVPPSAGDKV